MYYRAGALLAVFTFGSIVLWRSLTAMPVQPVFNPEVLGSSTSTFIHKDYPFNWERFFVAVEQVKKNGAARDGGSISDSPQGEVSGLIVPHHLLAGELIADGYKRLADSHSESAAAVENTQNKKRSFWGKKTSEVEDTAVKTVIILGPNHEEKGNYWALTSSGSWQTHKGVVEPDLAVIGQLQNAGVLQEDTALLQTEQSIGTQMPFIAEFLPSVKVVPIVLSNRVSREEIEQLVVALHDVMTEQTVIVASVDFSHYLRSDQAQQNDAEVRKLLEERNTAGLLQLAGNSDYLDSAPSLVTLLKLMDQLDVTETTILENTNSGILENNQIDPTTSYFEVIFSKK
jgi:AmmeMemoRadiSam system protein B